MGDTENQNLNEGNDEREIPNGLKKLEDSENALDLIGFDLGVLNRFLQRLNRRAQI